MGALTEIEIFACLSENLRLAAEKCEVLANHPRRGHLYYAFLKEIKLIEGACEQASAWRGDARWLRISWMMGEVHKRAGHWLRHSPTLESRVEADKRLKKLADNLRLFAYEAEDLRHKATGRLGLILPTWATEYVFEVRPWSLLFVNAGFWLVGTMLMGAIVGGWKKKV